MQLHTHGINSYSEHERFRQTSFRGNLDAIDIQVIVILNLFSAGMQ